MRLFKKICALLKKSVFKNWTENISSKVEIYYPENDSDIIQIIRNAKENDVNIRVVGKGHSMTPLVCDMMKKFGWYH